MEPLGDLSRGVEQKPGVLQPAIALAKEAHQGINGLDGKPLFEHCVRIKDDPTMVSEAQQLVALLHDASNPRYSTIPLESLFGRMEQIGCTEKVIGAVKCFVRPPEDVWPYDLWIDYLKRDPLTKDTKIADSKDALANFPPEREEQRQAWQRTLDRLSDDAPEPPETTARIEEAMRRYPLPDLSKL